jgi:hypothetical protein
MRADNRATIRAELMAEAYRQSHARAPWVRFREGVAEIAVWVVLSAVPLCLVAWMGYGLLKAIFPLAMTCVQLIGLEPVCAELIFEKQ